MAHCPGTQKHRVEAGNEATDCGLQEVRVDGGCGQLFIMGGAGGGRSPPGSGHVGLEQGEVWVSVPEEWVRFSCLPFP